MDPARAFYDRGYCTSFWPKQFLNYGRPLNPKMVGTQMVGMPHFVFCNTGDGFYFSYPGHGCVHPVVLSVHPKSVFGSDVRYRAFHTKSPGKKKKKVVTPLP